MTDLHKAAAMALEALESAKNGLRWYQAECPQFASATDDEMHEEIGDAIAALREALAAPVVPEWIAVSEKMPIPGKPVLACYKNGRKIIAFWTPAITVESDEDSEIGVYNEATDTYYDPEGWYECVENWDEFSSIFVDAGVITHWMELPDAPEPKEQT